MILEIDSTDSNRTVVKINLNKLSDTSISRRKFGSQVLLSQISKILKKNNKKFSDIKSIKVNRGPGSFTGTRVGVAVANALGYALEVTVNGEKGRIAVPKYKRSKFD